MAKGSAPEGIQKVPSGIKGLDDITFGGLPYGRPTLVCGSAGCGKSLLGVEFLVRGALEHNDPGVLMTFEETADDIRKNVASLGFDVDDLVRRKKLIVDFVRIERSEIEENGEYDLEGLFVRLDYAVRKIGAKRVLLDTIEALFAGLSNPGILRAELRRLFIWLKQRNLTTVITGERAGAELTRRGLEEFVSDCVILLDHRVINQVSTRRLRVVKYRGSVHGTNEYPFLIDEDGITVLPITSMSLNHAASTQRVSSGIASLDDMLGGRGYFKGSSVLISGTAGTGKTSMSATFARSVCAAGQKCIYFAFEESRSQIIRNMKSIGVDVATPVKKGLLSFYNIRPTAHGLEMHLAMLYKQITQVKPAACIFDPVTNLLRGAGSREEVNAMLTRLIDFLKSHNITALFTSLSIMEHEEATDVGISSLIDTWILLKDMEVSSERNRVLYILKSRGMNHSNQVREFELTGNGIQLLDVYLGGEGVLTGSARRSQEAREAASIEEHRVKIQRRMRDLENRRREMEAKVHSLRSEFDNEEREMEQLLLEEKRRSLATEAGRRVMARSRHAKDRTSNNGGSRR